MAARSPKIGLAVVIIFLMSIALLPTVRAQAPLTPDQIRAAYNVNPLLQSGYTGKGVTVAVVASNVEKTLYSDLKGFNSKFGLADTIISVAQPYDSGPTTVNGEETSDIELVHAMAPDAKILLVVVGSHSNLEGFSYVIDHNAADIATTSLFEWYWDSSADGSSAKTVRSYNDEYANSVKEKITLIATSGDYGSDNTVPKAGKTSTGDFWTKHLPYSYLMPLYSPWATIVGGTALTLQSGTYSETGWSGSGGGPSNLFPEPDWQTGRGVPQNHARNTPDIALNAACDTTYANYVNASWGNICGTSASAPTFAGIIADIEQAAGERLGFLNPTLYSLASSDPTVYHEITSGCSLLKPNPNDPATKPGYCAHAGWNFVTGWGSIDATRLAMHLAPRAHIEPATTTTTSREHSTEATSIIRESRTEKVNTNQSNMKGFEYSPYILAGLVIAALTIVGFTYARKRATKTQSG